MSIKQLTKLSHFITLMFGIAFGMTICILYQHTVAIFILGLTPVIILILLISSSLRIYTMFLWKKNNYSSKIFID